MPRNASSASKGVSTIGSPRRLNDVFSRSVGGDLYLCGIGITELPDYLTVGADLYLGGTAIIELPDNLKVGGRIYGFNPRARHCP
jgi:hypothetical protein